MWMSYDVKGGVNKALLHYTIDVEVEGDVETLNITPFTTP